MNYYTENDRESAIGSVTCGVDLPGLVEPPVKAIGRRKSPPKYLSINNIDRFFHYKYRNPAWVKLPHHLVFEDPAFLRLNELDQYRFIKLVLIATRCDNKIPNDNTYLQKVLHVTTRVDLTPLIDSGLLLAYRKQSALLEVEVEVEIDKEKSIVGRAPDPAPPAPVDNPSRIKEAEEVMTFLNEKSGKRFPLRSPRGIPTTNLSTVQQRLKDGYTVAQCMQVIAKKTRDWRGHQSRDGTAMETYLRPQTLFAKKNFETYVGELCHAV